LQRTHVENPPFSFDSDTGSATFAEFTRDGLEMAGQHIVEASLPPGSCTVTNFRFDAFKEPGKPVPPDPLKLFRVKELNAGGLISVTGTLGYRFLGLVQG